MMNTTKTFTTVLVAVVLAFGLAGCGSNAPDETVTPTPTQTTVPVPTPTETPVEEATEFDGTVVTEQNPDGSWTLPDGSTTTCPEESTGVFVSSDGEVTCDAGVDW